MANALHSRKNSNSDNNMSTPYNNSSSSSLANGSGSSSSGVRSPFANEATSAQINQVFDVLDRRLTAMMTEKTNLQDESERYVKIQLGFTMYARRCIVKNRAKMLLY